MPPETYRELRHFLLVRLALGAGLMIVVGVVAVTAVPGAATVAPKPVVSSGGAADSPPFLSAKSGHREPAASATIDPPSVPTNSGNIFEKPRLEELMQAIAAPEPLGGKAFEVLAKAADAQTTSAGTDADDGVTAKPAKLPKGPHLQAGIFAQPANAEEFRRKLVAEGYPAYVEFRVQIGPYPNRREAERVRDKLKTQGTTTIYVPQ